MEKKLNMQGKKRIRRRCPHVGLLMSPSFHPLGKESVFVIVLATHKPTVCFNFIFDYN